MGARRSEQQRPLVAAGGRAARARARGGGGGGARAVPRGGRGAALSARRAPARAPHADMDRGRPALHAGIHLYIRVLHQQLTIVMAPRTLSNTYTFFC